MLFDSFYVLSLIYLICVLLFTSIIAFGISYVFNIKFWMVFIIIFVIMLVMSGIQYYDNPASFLI